MKTTIALLTLLSFGPAVTQSQAEVSVSFFYDQLEPHGEWMDVGDYGYVWHPRDVSDDWRPYTDGRWAYTDAGWTWVSDEPYGWAVYHYGRWANLDRVGWVWVPGTEWGPAWVSWRRSERHVGWAPLPPEATFRVNVAIGAWADSYYDIGPANYTFVETRNLGAERIISVARPWRENITIINETRNITNITYQNNIVINQGPRYEEVVRVTERPIQRLRLERRTDFNANVRTADAFQTRLEGETLAVAAPTITRTGDAAPKRLGRKVAKAEVNRGWKGVGSEQEVQKLRAKVKSDSPQAPADLPKEPKFEREDKAAATTAAPNQPAKPGDATTPPAGRPGQPATSTAGETPAKPGEKTTTTPPATDTPTQPGADRPGRADRPDPNADTPGRPGRSARPGTPDRPETPADANRPGRTGRPDPSTRPDAPDREGRPGRSTAPGAQEKPELPAKPDAPGRSSEAKPQPDRPDRTNRAETPDRPNRTETPNRPNRPETPDRPDRAETPRNERPNQPDNRAARPERPSQPEERPNRATPPSEDRPGRAEQPEREKPRAERPEANAGGNRPERAERPQARPEGARPEAREGGNRPAGNNPAGENAEAKDPRAKKKE